MRNDVVTGGSTLGIHEVNSDGGIVELVTFDDVVIAVPQAQAITTHTQFEVLGLDTVASDGRVVDLCEVDTEQAVIDDVVFDHIVVAAHIEAGVVGVVRVTGAGQMNAANDRVAGIQHHYRALVTGIDGHLAATIDGQWLVDGHRAGVDARWRLQDRAGFGFGDQCLKGFQAVDTLVTFHQHEGGFGSVDGDARGCAQVGIATELLFGVADGAGEDGRKGNPRLG